MGIEKLLSENTILKSLSIQIAGVELIQDDIISIEFFHNFFEFGITGKLEIKDSFDIFNNGEIKFYGNQQLTIYINDFLNEKTKKQYRITSINVKRHNDRFKYLSISFIDEISYILKNTYISKGFTDTPVNAFVECLDQFGINNILTDNNMILNVNDTSSVETFTIPQDRSIFDFFEYLFTRHNIRIWQDSSSLNISEIVPSALSIKQLDENDVVYSNRTLNNFYIFKIHDYEEYNNQLYDVLRNKPKELIYRYNNVKTILNETENLKEVFPNLKTNTLEMEDLQTFGVKTRSQSSNSVKKQQYELFDNFMNLNQIDIVVPGTIKYNNIGFLAKIELKGNPLFADTEKENDFYSSGYYFISEVQDRIIGDKFIQKIRCIRLDSTKPRKYK